MNQEKKRSITWRDLIQSPPHFLAFGLGSGLSPIAPGTAGTLMALPLVWGVSKLPIAMGAALVLVCILIGIWICQVASNSLNSEDHPGIVWDEITGMLLTMLFIPLSWSTLVAGFLLFRFFDIVKPWPIRYFDRQIHGGLGIMVDDIVAGIIANILLRLSVPYLPVL